MEGQGPYTNMFALIFSHSCLAAMAYRDDVI